MYSRLHVGATGIASPVTVNAVHRYALAALEATRNSITEANC